MLRRFRLWPLVLVLLGSFAFVACQAVTNENAAPISISQLAPTVSLLAPQPVAQPAQQVAAPVIKEWPKVRVQWQRVAQPVGVTAFTKIDDRFYTGTTQNAQAGSVPTPEGTAFARKILPQLETATAIFVAAARDPVDKDIVLASIGAIDDRTSVGYLLFSADGGTSWHELNLPLEVSPHTGTTAVRITADGYNVYPVVRGSNVAEEWYGTTIKRSWLSTP